MGRDSAGITRQKRAAGLYSVDRSKQIKRSKDNFVMKQLYEGILKDKSHIMHTHR